MPLACLILCKTYFALHEQGKLGSHQSAIRTGQIAVLERVALTGQDPQVAAPAVQPDPVYVVGNQPIAFVELQHFTVQPDVCPLAVPPSIANAVTLEADEPAMFAYP
jgi:hypothetical protein